MALLILCASSFVERSETRRGYANAIKPKTRSTRLGSITFVIPQIRGEIDFYPPALERGSRSEQTSLWPWPKWTCRVCPLAKSPPFWRNFTAPPSAPLTSTTATPTSPMSAPARSALLLTSSSMPVTKKIRQAGCVLDGAVFIALGVGP
jgi:hypothetical protein